MSPLRRRIYELVRGRLGQTRVGRSLGLSQLRTFEDFRSVVPIFDAATHAEQIEHRLGFGVVDPDDPAAPEILGLDREREDQAAVWRRFFHRSPPRLALWLGRGDAPAVARALAADAAALAPPVYRHDRLDDPAAAAARLCREGIEALWTSSLAAVQAVEAALRRPLETAVPTLEAIIATYDLDAPVRTRLPVVAAGFIHGPDPVRLSVSSMRSVRVGTTLALASALPELLPHRDPEVDGRVRAAEATVLPEQARPDERYEVVVTSPAGVIRLRTGLHVRVVGFDMPSTEVGVPRPRFVPIVPAPPDLPLEGCTLAGSWVAAAVRQAFWPEDPALVAAEVRPDPAGPGPAASSASLRVPPFFAETELGPIVRAATGARRARPRGLWVRVELQGVAPPDLSDRLARRIDDDLRRRMPAYAYLRQRGSLSAPRVEVVAPGTWRAARERAVRRLWGPVGQPAIRVVSA